MKKIATTLCLTVLLIVGSVQQSRAIIWVIAKAVIKKAIKAVDLQVQRQQNKVIALQNIQKTIENVMAKARLDEITDWSKKQKDQYQKYFDELHKVKSLISYYYRVREITDKEARLMREYSRAWGLVQQDKHFTPAEIEHIGQVYGGILKETLKNVDDLAMVINAFKTEMSDAKRLEIINAAGEKIDDNYHDLMDFKNANGLESLRRAKNEQDANMIRSMYGLPI